MSLKTFNKVKGFSKLQNNSKILLKLIQLPHKLQMPYFYM